jgi:hypothetical protein
MLAVGIKRRTLRKPQALNGALRQFASVTSLSGEGGKSSIRSADILSQFIAFGGFAGSGAGTAITFRRGSNLTIAIADTEHSHKPLRYRAKSRATRWNKMALLPFRNSRQRSVLRLRREATKLRPRCLMRVAAQ